MPFRMQIAHQGHHLSMNVGAIASVKPLLATALFLHIKTLDNERGAISTISSLPAKKRQLLLMAPRIGRRGIILRDCADGQASSLFKLKLRNRDYRLQMKILHIKQVGDACWRYRIPLC